MNVTHCDKMLENLEVIRIDDEGNLVIECGNCNNEININYTFKTGKCTKCGREYMGPIR